MNIKNADKTAANAYNYFADVNYDLIKNVFKCRPRENVIPKISVIVATYNRDHLITRALIALVGQDMPKDFFEIIIVNDGSNDKTEEKVKNFINQDTSTNIAAITLGKNLGSSYARNVGILYARGEFIAITDDDCIVPKNWLSDFIEAFKKHPEIIAVGGGKKPYRDNAVKPSQYDTFMFWRRLPYMKTEFKSTEINPFNNCGDTANVCYKKSALKKVGGFNHCLKTWNDWELKMRLHQLGAPLLYRPIFVLHEADLGFRKFIRYWLRLGYDGFLISKIHRDLFVFNTSLRAILIRNVTGISYIIKAPSDEIFKKTVLQTLFFIFLEISINACLWLGKDAIQRN